MNNEPTLSRKTSDDEIPCDFVFVPEFLARAGFKSRVTLDNLEKQTDDFPERVQLGRRPGAKIGWHRRDVDRWLESRPRGFGPAPEKRKLETK